MVQLTGKRWPLVGKRLVADMPFIETEVGTTNLVFRDLQFQPNVFVQPTNSFDYVKSMVAQTRHRSEIYPEKNSVKYISMNWNFIAQTRHRFPFQY